MGLALDPVWVFGITTLLIVLVLSYFLESPFWYIYTKKIQVESLQTEGQAFTFDRSVECRRGK